MQQAYEVEFSEWNITRIQPEIPVLAERLVISQSYGFLKFRIEDLGKSRLLDQAKVFYVDFWRNDPNDIRDAWADPLRALVLERLMKPGLSWYISFVGDVADPRSETGYKSINQDFQDSFLIKYPLNHIELTTQESNNVLQKRLFVEVPQKMISLVVQRYWPKAWPAYPIQGLLMGASQISILKEWAKRIHNAELLSDILNQTRVLFYTFPAENRNFIFITNKLDAEDMLNLLDLSDLKERAIQIGLEKFDKE